jgi:hypothetical protein
MDPIVVGARRICFLTDTPPAARLASVITNPPFTALDEFIRRGLALLDIGATQAFTLLWRWDHFMAEGRVALLNRAAFVHQCCWRARWIEGSTGQPRWDFAWVTWLATDPGPPRLVSHEPDQPRKRRERRKQYELNF